jgi:hypothetical protein
VLSGGSAPVTGAGGWMRAAFAVHHGALPHPERMKIRLIFHLLNIKNLTAIFTAEN